MQEKIKIKLNCYNNGKNFPCFRILSDEKILTEEYNYTASHYEKTFQLELSEGKHTIVIEHFNKYPKHSLVKESKIIKDVAIELIELCFHEIKCSSLELYNCNFYIENWPDKKINNSVITNSLYFGYNGRFVYPFKSPSIKYILGEMKKYQVENSELDDFKISEDEFISKLDHHTELEKKYYNNS